MFTIASALCGATPTGSLAEPWIIIFRVIQGAGAAIMFPAALAIVVAAYPVDERGKALAIFFGVAGGLTAIGPMAGRRAQRVDLAGDLLGQHPGGGDRHGADAAARSPTTPSARRRSTTEVPC